MPSCVTTAWTLVSETTWDKSEQKLVVSKFDYDFRMNNHDTQDLAEDEISLLDIVRFFIDNASWITASTLGCGLLGLGFGFLAPKQYEATMNIQMAMVVNTPVETPAVLLEKIKLPLYFSPNAWKACDTDGDQTPSRSLAKKLNPILNKQAPLIGFSYRDDSPIAAQQCLEAVLADIREKQNLLAQPVIQQKKNLLETLKAKLLAAEQVTKYLETQKQSFQFKDERFSANALVLATSLSKENEVKDLRSAISELEISLGKPQTQETYLAAPMYASQQAVFPNKLLSIVLFLLSGFVLGVLSIGVRHVWRSTRKQLALKP